MNDFTVEWLPEAEDELAMAWIQAQNRPALTGAQAVIDRLLAKDPLGNGEDVAEGLRKIAVVPLIAYYEVDAAQRRVVVSNVAHLPAAS